MQGVDPAPTQAAPVPSSTPSSTSPPTPDVAPSPAPEPISTELIERALFVEVMGYDPSQGRLDFGPSIERVTFFEALAFANRLSERAGLPACYELACDKHPDDPRASSAEAVAPAVHLGCPLLDQPFCIDPRPCQATRRPTPCGYRVPSVSEWRALRPPSHPGLAEWLWDDRVSSITSRDATPVGGRTRLSSPTAPPDRVAPTLTSIKASHIGFRLVPIPP